MEETWGFSKKGLFMQSEWFSNKEASGHVCRLLQQAGIPLELQVASICTEFCLANSASEDINLSTEKIVYSKLESEEEYRELDQKIVIYSEFEVSEFTGVQLVLDVPIECKYRSDIEYFAFPNQDHLAHQGFPLLGGFAGSSYFRLLTSTYEELKNHVTANITMVEIGHGKTPEKIHKENLIYNAAGALYDFIIFDVSQQISNEVVTSDELVEKLGLFDEFQNYLKKNGYLWWTVLRSWIASIETSKCDLFNREYFGGQRVYTGLSMYLPIVCVNGPIYKVNWNPRDGIESFEEIEYSLSTIRKTGWPATARFRLLNRTREVAIVLTNPNGLRTALKIGLNWYERIRSALTEADTVTIGRWALETAFFRKVVSHYKKQEPDEGYRSDLAMDDELL